VQRIIHIADAACSALTARAPRPRAVGLIATKGTVAAGFFQERLAACGCDCVLSSDEEQEALVLPAITAVKGHDLARAHELAVRACKQLQARGAEAIILACTEIPLAVEYGDDAITEACIDPTRELARACVAWWQAHRPR
jgi:aspartate racemase